jgi:hypothetical protein
LRALKWHCNWFSDACNKVPLLVSCYRQAELRCSFGFACACNCCLREPDGMRRLPCPRCATRDTRRGRGGKLPQAVVLGEVRPAGVLTHDPVRAAAGQLPWQCSNCGAELRDDDVELFGMADLLAAGGLGDALALPGTRGGKLIGGGSSSSSSQVLVEDVVSRVVRQYDRQMDAGVGSALHAEQQLQALLRAVGGIVGPDHWALHALLLIKLGM